MPAFGWEPTRPSQKLYLITVNQMKYLILLRIGIGFIGSLIFIMTFYLYIAYVMPLPPILQNTVDKGTTKIYDRRGELLYEVLQPEKGKKTFIPLEQIPKKFILATLAAEDIHFYEHAGVDFGAILRAILFNVKEGRIVTGGSTITQQLVRNLFSFRGERSVSEKILEAMYAVRLSHVYDKNHVLELYLNTIYYGNLAYGGESAALDYFAKHIYDLDLAESTLLTGLPQAPSAYNPLVYFDQAKKRQKYVLDQMVKYSFVSAEEADLALKEPLRFRKNKTVIKAPHFVMYILNELENIVGKTSLAHGGFSVYTTLDYRLQRMADETVSRHVKSLSDKNVTNGALLAIQPKTGDILAWVGSENYFNDDIDGAVDNITSLRQPGSAIKPFNYLLALEQGYTPATLLFDTQKQFETATGPYTPKNYDLKFHGPVRLREALASSLNVAAVKLLDSVGVENLIMFLKKFGMNTFDKGASFYGLALTLGGGEVRMLDLARAYNVIANYGDKISLNNIHKIIDTKGKIIFQKTTPQKEFILGKYGKEHAYQIIDILKDPAARLKGFGEGSVLELSREAAVKTGTTRNFRDNWTVGFTPQLLTAVWVGNADAKPMKNISGVDGAGPIWHDFMESALEFEPKLTFEKPHQLKEIEICALSGKLPTSYCAERVFEIFVPDTEPKDFDDYYRQFWILKNNGHIVQDACVNQYPLSEREQKVFVVYPPELQNWVRQNKLELPPAEQCVSSRNPSDISSKELPFIENPQNGDEYALLIHLPIQSQKIPFQVVVPASTMEVAFWLDGKEISIEKSAPFTYFWKPMKGQHILFVKAVQGDGQMLTSKEVVFTVK